MFSYKPLGRVCLAAASQCLSAGPLLCVLGVGRHFSQLDYSYGGYLFSTLRFIHFICLFGLQGFFPPMFNVVQNADLVQHCSSRNVNALTLGLDRL